MRLLITIKITFENNSHYKKNSYKYLPFFHFFYVVFFSSFPFHSFPLPLFPSFPPPHYTTLHPHHNIFAYNPHPYHTSYPDHTQRDPPSLPLFSLSLCVWCGCGA